MAKPRLAPIYERLAGAPQYHPMNAETFADWSLEAGDIVTVKREGTEYSSPVQTVRMKWNGVPTTQIESVGEKKRESIAKMSAQKYARGAGGGGGVRNSHYQHIFVQDAYGRMQSGLELTGSTAKLYAEDLYAQMGSGLALTTSSAHLYVDDRYNQMSSGLALTSSTAALYVDDKYNQMKSGLDLTTSSAHLYVDDKYRQMSSGLKLTSSSAALYVDNKYNQMKSGLDLTASSAALYVDDKYNQMSSGLKLTSSSAALYVDNKYNQMKSGLSITMSSAVMYARSKDAAAEIVARINEDNEGEIKLDAQHVYIGNQKSTTVINGKLNVNDLKARIADIAIVEMVAAQITGNITCHGAVSVGKSLAVNQIYGITNGGTGTFSAVNIGGNSFDNVIVSASVKGNTLTLTPLSGDAVTFSKAISSATWTWAGGAPKVTLSPQDQTFYGKAINGITFTGKKTWAKDNKSFTQDFYCYDEASNNVYTENLSIDTKDSYNAGYNNGSPNGTVTIGSKITGTNYNISISRSDGTAVAGTKDFDSIYKAAREGYTAGTFTPLTARPVVSSGGTVYYQAGTAVTYYKGNGSSGYLCGTGETCYKAGTERTFNLRASSGIKLKKYGTGKVTLYVAPTTSATGITHEWYYIDSGGTSYYQSGGTVTVTSQGESQTLYPRGSYVYGRGDTVSVTPITGTAIRIGAAGTYYSKS